MNELHPARRRYRWPWFVAAAVLLAIILAVIFMTIAVQKIEHERDFNAPLPASKPVR